MPVPTRFLTDITAIGGVILTLGAVLTFVGVIVAGRKWAWTTKVAHSPEAVAESRTQFKTALVAFAGAAVAAAVSLIIGALL